MSVEEIRSIVCETLEVSEEDMLTRCGKTRIKFAQYIFCYYAYLESMDKEKIMRMVGATHVNKISEYIRRHNDFMYDSVYRRMAENIANKIQQ